MGPEWDCRKYQTIAFSFCPTFLKVQPDQGSPTNKLRIIRAYLMLMPGHLISIKSWKSHRFAVIYRSHYANALMVLQREKNVSLTSCSLFVAADKSDIKTVWNTHTSGKQAHTHTRTPGTKRARWHTHCTSRFLHGRQLIPTTKAPFEEAIFDEMLLHVI